MLLQILALLTVLSLAVFLVPLRFKWIVSLTVSGSVAVCAIVAALRVLTTNAEMLLPQSDSLIFGTGSASVDRLSATFILILSAAVLSVTVYSRGYLKPYYEKKSPIQFSIHYFALTLMYLAMLLVVTMRDAFGFLFSWELMTITSFLLILFEGEKREVRQAAINYLILMHVGFIFLLAGFVAVAAEGLPATFDSLPLYFGSKPGIALFLLFLTGFGMKAGIFPLHMWLPRAHPAAPSHISAFMSGVMIKTGIYGIFRVACSMDQQLYAAGLILLTVGVATGLWGVLNAAIQNDMKKLLAYSSIENIGIILAGLGIGLLGKAAGNTPVALYGIGGALLHTVNHSFFKTLLFLGTGNVYAATHSTSIDALGGIGKRMPLTSILFFSGVLAICALPPLSGFVSEFMIYLGLFEGLTADPSLAVVSAFGILVLALIGGIVVLAFTKLYGIVFLGTPRSKAAGRAREASRSMLAGMALPLAGIVVIGLFPLLFLGGVFETVAALFGIENAGAHYAMMSGDLARLAYAILILTGTVVIVWMWRRIALRDRNIENTPTWGCGFTAPTPKMQYSGESFSEGLARITRRMTGGRHDKRPVFGEEEIFPGGRNFEVKREDRIDTLFNAWWVEAMRRLNKRLDILRTGKVNYYILYAILFFILIFLLSLLNLI